MRILIDIGHPAHVHYFKNFIKIMNEKGHKIVVVARKRDVIHELLSLYNIPFRSRGKGANSMLGKLAYTILADLIILYHALRYRVDVLMSFSTGYTAQVGWLLGRYTISINDTEHTNKTHSKFVYPFSNSIITPHVYYATISKNHIKFNSTIEGLYLSEKYYKPQTDIYNYLKIKPDEEYVLVRFISWNAHHDKGYQGLSNSEKTNIVSLIQQKYKVFISSEEELPTELEAFKLNIPVDRIHDVIYYSRFFISESGTMASEAAYLGVSVIYTNKLPLMGYLREANKYHLLDHITNYEEIVSKLEVYLKNEGIKVSSKLNAKKMKENFIDITKLLYWFVENYPQSHNKLIDNSEAQIEIAGE